MIQLTNPQLATLRDWFLPDRPGPLIGLHLLNGGHGTAWADRWPAPQAIYVETAQNGSLAGDPTALTPAMIRDVVVGFIEAPAAFVPLLQEVFPDLVVWDRVIYKLPAAPIYRQPTGFTLRRLTSADARHLANLSDESSWISKTWGGPAGLAASGYAWGAFAGDQLAAVANSFFLGDQYEEIGVVTEPVFRGRGVSVACSGALCEEIRARGRIPSWTTSPDNIASKRVAEKLGFQHVRDDHLYVVGINIPKPAS
ncbi:MAG: GNAT family N-acetyltransferase [Caldilinea sp. CFX5]|nr:GNAT family N-acetyltransferase [Caldilinea sp. CFX5]